jgi:hypothetical protein
MTASPRIAANETDLSGAWEMRGGKLVADPVCARIEWLVSNQLVHLGTDSGGWDELYRDPDDGRMWELTWPQSELHGGGPPRLTCLMIQAARDKYGAIVDR